MIFIQFLFDFDFEVKTRQYGFFLANILVTMFGMMGIFGGLVIANIITVTGSSYCSIFSNTCTTNPYLPLNITMIVLGVIAFITCIVYFIALPISVQGTFLYRQNRGNTNMNMYPYNAQYGQQQPMQPFPTGPQPYPNMNSQQPPSYQ
jgi:hypothetical protein